MAGAMTSKARRLRRFQTFDPARAADVTPKQSDGGGPESSPPAWTQHEQPDRGRVTHALQHIPSSEGRWLATACATRSPWTTEEPHPSHVATAEPNVCPGRRVRLGDPGAIRERPRSRPRPP